jgi:uncharacterized protein YjdB
MFRCYLKPAIDNASPPYKANNIAQIYKFPPPPNTPVTVSVLSFGGGIFGTVSSSGVVTDGDVQAYWTSIGISTTNHPKVVVLPIDGATNAPVAAQDETIENTMDVEMIGACCPTATLTILLFIAPNSLSEFPNLINKATSPITIDGVVYTPSIVSISWGATEIYYSADLLTTINATLKTATAKGINFCAATGDNGSTDGVPGNLNYVDFPSSSPYVTACGGTNLICPSLKYSDPTTVEKAWSSGGGGISGTFMKPTWQTPIAGATGPYRCLPDIALVADPSTGVDFIVGGTHYTYGGTSIVAPAMAAYYACVNTNTFLLPALYTASATLPFPFNDITVGSNGAYNAKPGFDFCTGFGSIIGDLLTLQLKTPQVTVPVTGISLDTTSVNVGIGKQLSIVALVTPANATNKSMTWSSSNSLIATVLPIACPSVNTRECGCSASCVCGCVTGSTCTCVKPMNSGCDCKTDPSVLACSCNGPIVLLNDETGKMTVQASSYCNCTKTNNTCGCVSVNSETTASSATCDSVGLVTGIAVGTTTITATTADGNFTASASVNVINIPVTIPVTGISLNMTSLTLSIGSTKQLIATITPPNATNTSVLWTSTSTTVTVSSSGLVTAKSSGSATIIARTVDGGFTARVLVTVPTPLISIAFSPSAVVLYTYTRYQSNLVFNPVTAKPTTVTYTSLYPNIASVNASGVITTLSRGITVIKATASGKTASLTVYVIANNLLYFSTKSTVTPIKTRKYSDYGQKNNNTVNIPR